MTPKQQAFVSEYLIDLNATQAAIRAGYSPKTAEQLGYQLLQHPSVRAAVDEALEKRRVRTEVTQDEVVGGLKTIAAATANPAAARVSAWVALGKHLGMFKDRVEHTGLDGGPIVVEDRSASLEDVAKLLRDTGAIT